MADHYHFQHIYGSEEFADVDIRFKHEFFKGHKAILCERSRLFREILLKGKTLTEIDFNNHPRSSTLDYDEWKLIDLARAIYTGCIAEVDDCPCIEMRFATGIHDLGIKTGTPMLEEAAVELEERRDHEKNADEISHILNDSFPVIFNREPASEFPLNDANIRKMLIDNYFPLISQYVSLDKLTEALQKSPDFAVEYAVYLEKLREGQRKLKPEKPS
ncbi:hypothetical protein IWX90DRAFT_489683 [Phyllosticta citrichinensis]|uniref:BTB domain-containing protein n=1 Tax=Phyllosticta citrichinensis TaxID=1130410 RepID=A0ABR1XI48_9PEZI